MREVRQFVAADLIIEKGNKILLVKRKIEPFKGTWGLPGGRMDAGETIEQTAIREMKEETRVRVKLTDILGVYSGTKRDPRGVCAVVFIAKYISGKPRGGDDAKIAKFVPEKEVFKYKLGFDHKKILRDYFKWRKNKGTYWSTK